MSIAFIVDGYQEKLVLQRLCGDVPIKMTQLNGRDVNIPAITKVILSMVKLLKGRHFPIVIIVDRERRQISSMEVENQIRTELIAAGIDSESVIISSPDRMVENWILCGNPYCKSATRILQQMPVNLDGVPGKREIKAALRKHGIFYDETGNGVDLFCTMNLKEAADGSPSFSRLFGALKLYCPKLRHAGGEA